MRSCLPAVMLLALAASPTAAADLSKIDRVLKKEPVYRSGRPQYGLLVFGPEAQTRVWLVQDGNTLYVDRNGNGDLTEAGETVGAEKGADATEGTYSFAIGEIRDGPRLHKELRLYVSKIDHLAELDESVKAFLAKNPKGRGYLLMCEVEMPGWKGPLPGGRVRLQTFYMDTQNVLQLADQPRSAPIIHFGGPWQVTLFGSHRLTIGREKDVCLGVGTPGVGPATMTYIAYERVIPEKVYPTVEITYPPAKPNEPPRTEHYVLKRRC